MGMFSSAKKTQHLDQEDMPDERRKSADRRVSNEETRFPYIDDDCRLVIKDRRNASRRTADAKFNKTLKTVSKFFKK